MCGNKLNFIRYQDILLEENCAVRQNTFLPGAQLGEGVIQKNLMSLGGQEENVSKKEHSPALPP